MSLSFAPPKGFDDLVPGIRVYPRSSPAPVVFQDKIYIFYVGSGNDGIFYTVYDGKGWAPVVSARTQVPNIDVFEGTSPAVVVFNGKLYLFYNGAGHDGTWYASFDGSKWSGYAESVNTASGGQNFLEGSSPSATVYGGKLYLFWNGASDDGIWFSTFDAKWSSQTRLNTLVGGISLDPHTSPSVCTVDTYLYVFYNGFGHDGTWFTRLAKNGQWDAVKSVNMLIFPGGMNTLEGSSPAATPLTVNRSASVLLVWNGASDDGLWYTIISTDGKGTQQVSLDKAIGAGTVLHQSTGGVCAYHDVPFVFWVNNEQQLWYTSAISH